MKSHELAKELLSLPDCEVVTHGIRDSLFSVTSIESIKVVQSGGGNQYYEYNPGWHRTEPTPAIILS